MQHTLIADPGPELIPRFANQGYDPQSVMLRRQWLAKKTGTHLKYMAEFGVSTDEMQGNVENPVGAAQVPLGIAGPLLIHGLHANGVFYIPLATTEGALVRSYERGMAVLTRSGGVDARIYLDENCIAPVFCFEGVVESHEFASGLQHHFDDIRREAERTTQHGKLLRIEPHVQGRNVTVKFSYYTADAHGMNLIAKATDCACRWMLSHLGAKDYYLYSGFESEKHASANLFTSSKGKKVTAGARLPARLLELYLRATPTQFARLWQQTVLGHIQAHSVGYNGHFANGLAAIFIACGQDVGNLPNCAVGITNFELTDRGDLYASVTLPSLTVATIGGGTAYGTARECLGVLGCGTERCAPKLAEVIAATLLAGELSIGAAIISHEFVAAHETYGRNRPKGEPSRFFLHKK